MVLELIGAVGRASAAGTPASNRAMDQQLVSELLDAQWHPPLIPLVDRLPPIEDGRASEELCVEIERFQTDNELPIVDGRVSVGQFTWQALLERAEPAFEVPVPPPIVLSLTTLDMHDLPRLASGLPSITYRISGQTSVFFGPGVILEFTPSGSLKVDWGNALPFAVAADAATAELQTKVNAGTAQQTPGIVLADESTQIQLESRAAIGSLFAAVTVGFGLDGAPTLGGTIGDAEGFVSVNWDPVARAIIYRGERQVFKVVPTSFGATVTVTGRLRVELKITSSDLVPDEASIVAALAVLIPLGVVLVPVIEIAGAEAMLEVVGEAILKLVPDALVFSPL